MGIIYFCLIISVDPCTFVNVYRTFPYVGWLCERGSAEPCHSSLRPRRVAIVRPSHTPSVFQYRMSSLPIVMMSKNMPPADPLSNTSIVSDTGEHSRERSPPLHFSKLAGSAQAAINIVISLLIITITNFLIATLWT